MTMAISILGVVLGMITILLTFMWRSNGQLSKQMMAALERIEQGQERMLQILERIEQGQERIIQTQERMEQGQRDTAQILREVAQMLSYHTRILERINSRL